MDYDKRTNCDIEGQIAQEFVEKWATLAISLFIAGTIALILIYLFS
jgi:hypothetical protein